MLSAKKQIDIIFSQIQWITNWKLNFINFTYQNKYYFFLILHFKHE